MSRRRGHAPALAVALVVACGCGGAQSGGSPGGSASATAGAARTGGHAAYAALAVGRPSAPPGSPGPLGPQRKTSGCLARGQLPDAACTPGGVFPKATAAEICRAGYAKRVRNVLPSTKDAVYSAYGIRAHRAGRYEIDHLVPLELGGNNTRANLWPQVAPGYGEKDAVENELHARVCEGRISLSTAQLQVARDWRHAGVPVPSGVSSPALGPAGRRPRVPPSSAPPPAGATFCATHRCIASFADGRGSIVLCADGEYSHSGGLRGVCSRHGGLG